MNGPNIVNVGGAMIDLLEDTQKLSADKKAIGGFNRSCEEIKAAPAFFLESVKNKMRITLFKFNKRTVFYEGFNSEMSLYDINEKLDGKCAELESTKFSSVAPMYYFFRIFVFDKDRKYSEICYENMPEQLKHGTPENTSGFEYERDMRLYIRKNIPKNGCILMLDVFCRKYQKPFFSASVFRENDLGIFYKHIIDQRRWNLWKKI